MNEKLLVRKITDAIESENATFMFGAGISVFRQSGCPSWVGMVQELIRNIAAENIDDPIPFVAPHLGLLFNETFFQIMSQTLSASQTHDAIVACLDAPAASHIHRFAAWCSNRFGTRLLTTNFDELIEKSDLKRSERQIAKLHGTLTDAETLRFRTNSVFAPLESGLRRKTARFIDQRTLLVAGYGGWDTHDVMPALFRDKKRAKEVIWIHHPGDPPTDNQVTQYFDESTTIVSADIDVILQQVYQHLAKNGARDDRLDFWGISPESCSDPNWWVRNIATWATGIRVSQPGILRLLWARLANHVRLYRVVIEGVECNLADEAYESILDLDDPVLRFEARARAAYMGRTMGRSKQAARDLQKIIKEIRALLKSKQPPAKQAALRYWLGWSEQQCGTALQGENRFKEANEQLETAIETRRTFNDPELPFAEFQYYMNGRRALEVGKQVEGPFYDFAWQKSFARRLDRLAQQFEKRFEMSNHSQTLHNAAFVYQSLALDARRFGKPNDQVLELANESRIRYEKAADIRDSTRDPRMIAQSSLRLAQVSIFQAVHEQYRDLPLNERFKRSEQLIGEARQHATKIREIYDRVPQEKMRYDHLDQLENDCDTFLGSHFPRKHGDWFPANIVRSSTDADSAAMEIRAKKKWHLAVVTAVFDSSHRSLLMAQLGDYAKKRFGGHAWVLPGGSVDKGETPSEAAIREVKEETGLSLDPDQLRPIGWFARVDLTPHHKTKKGEVLLLFGAKLDSRRPKLTPSPPEVVNAKWIGLNLKRWKSGSLQTKHGGVFPDHHMYWGRLAQAELESRQVTPRFMVYENGNMSVKPWLAIEDPYFSTEAFY
ncbi:MAG: NUDIX domain-containing protein [Planctomycetota bacterium]